VVTVEQAIAILRQRAEAHWLDWVVGRGNWPIRLRLRPPAAGQVGQDLLAVQTWSGRWKAASSNGEIVGTVEWVPRRIPGMTTFNWPNLLTIDTPELVLVLFPDLKSNFERTADRLDQAAAIPQVSWDRRHQAPLAAARSVAAVDDAEWAAALEVVDYLGTHPVTDMMLRQLPIPGISTKWLEAPGHAALILILMFPDEPREGREPLAHLTALLGLRTTAPKINITLTGSELRTSAGGLVQFAASVAVLNRSTIKQPETVLVIENVEPGHTFTGEYHRLAIIHGLGKAVSLIGSLRWLHDANQVLYWGDIDRAGFACLSMLRDTGVKTRSILMDDATLDEHRGLCRTTTTQQPHYTIPVHLTADEVQVYERLNSYHRVHGFELQLEQERIDWSRAKAAIDAALGIYVPRT
jgi:hypothetical protein